MYVNKLLSERIELDRPVIVVLVGAGRFGTSVAAQLGKMSGIRLGVVCDLREVNSRAALEAGAADSAIIGSDDPSKVAEAESEARPVLEAALLVTASGSPSWPPAADTVTVAKTSLEPGDTLNGSGGCTVRGVIERYEVSLAERLLPPCLSAGPG